MNSNMINPANYYNPFAKYNYTSKTRGAYVPALSDGGSNSSVTKSADIWSDNYDPSLEVEKCLENESSQNSLKSGGQTGITGFISKLFS